MSGRRFSIAYTEADTGRRIRVTYEQRPPGDWTRSVEERSPNDWEPIENEPVEDADRPTGDGHTFLGP